MLALLLAGRAGLFAGRAPRDLEHRDGRSNAPVPVATGTLPLAPIARLAEVVEAMPGGVVVTQRDDYLHAQFTTAVLRFVHDVECWADPGAGVLHLRSASRLGRHDFGANRQRIEAIRERLALAAPD